MVPRNSCVTIWPPNGVNLTKLHLSRDLVKQDSEPWEHERLTLYNDSLPIFNAMLL